MNSIYIATRLDYWELADELRLALEVRGVMVTARWIDKAKQGKATRTARLTDDQRATFAARDQLDIDMAELLVFISIPGKEMPGATWEAGYAIGKGKMVVHIGERSHLFHYHPEVIHYENVADFLEWVDETSRHHEIIVG